MAEDQFISRMLDETFAQEKSAPRARTIHAEEEFHRRRGLGRLPVTAFEGQWLMPGMARFVVNGHVLDLPLNHTPFQAWSEEQGRVVSGAFVRVLGQLTNRTFSHMFVVKSSDGHPWLVAWDQQKAKIDAAKLQSLFMPPMELKKAA